MTDRLLHKIIPVNDALAPVAVRLLARFFAEEGFAGDPGIIAANFDRLRGDPHHWAALAFDGRGRPAGVVTATTMLYVEWGRLGEVGDLYVVPRCRRRGVAHSLVRAAAAWCREIGCSAVSVTITPEGQASYRLSDFYNTLGFAPTGRTISVLRLTRGSN